MGLHTISSVNLVFRLHLVLHLIVSKKSWSCCYIVKPCFAMLLKQGCHAQDLRDAVQKSGCIYAFCLYIRLMLNNLVCVSMSRHCGMVASQH